MPIGIYPPILQSSQAPFIYNTPSYPIYFNLQKITSLSGIGHIQIRLVKQTNNKSIVNINEYPDGIIYKSREQIFMESNFQYYVSILRNDLSESWQPGCLYKVQIRFGSTEMFSDKADFTKWKKEQIDGQTFSEWSTVMIIKPIHQPDVYIENERTGSINSTEILQTERTEATLTPLFMGAYEIEAEDKELLDQYKFDLYLGDRTIEDLNKNPYDGFIESSGWKQHNASTNTLDQYRFKHVLTNDSYYTVFYSIKTVNGYTETANPYKFLATRTYLYELKDVELTVESESEFCRENGCISLYLSSKDNQYLTGSFVITRSTEETNFEVWEDIKHILCNMRKFDNEPIFQDFTIESGIRYKYAIQQENIEGFRTSPVYDIKDRAHSVDFEYSYFYHNNVQLKLKLNNSISSFKHTTLTSKQDTLGDRYPHLVKNGYAYYAEFPISGMISFQMDDDQTFLQLNDKGFYYSDELTIPRDKFEEYSLKRLGYNDEYGTLQSGNVPNNYNNLTIDTNLTYNNIFVERKFREKVEEFLNNFDYKLFKSPTEGNIVIVLQNVSLSPEQALGRMIYSFNATAYEVLNNTLENLDEYGIIDIGGYQTLDPDEAFYSFGQISGIHNLSEDLNIFKQIKEQEEVNIGGGYKLQLKRINSFWIERYPQKEHLLEDKKVIKDEDNKDIVVGNVRIKDICFSKLIELEAKLAMSKNDGLSEEKIAEIEREIDKYEKIQSAVAEGWLEGTVALEINGKTILVAPHKIYSLTYPISSLKLIASEYPIIINYICELNQIEDVSLGVVTAIDTSKIWGQIYGVFTDNSTVIKGGYNYKYTGQINQSPYRVPSSDTYNEIKDQIDKNLQQITNTWKEYSEQVRGVYASTLPDAEKTAKIEQLYDYYSEKIKGLEEENQRLSSYASDAGMITYDKNGNILMDNTNYNLYNTLNLYKVIEEEVKQNIELMYDIKEGFYKNEFGQWTDGIIRYELLGLNSFEIEAPPNTTLKIGRNPDGSDANIIKIGKQGKYRLSPLDGLVRYIAFVEPSFAIVNYRCFTIQMRVRTE